jgi:hypothetical protein
MEFLDISLTKTDRVVKLTVSQLFYDLVLSRQRKIAMLWKCQHLVIYKLKFFGASGGQGTKNIIYYRRIQEILKNTMT